MYSVLVLTISLHYVLIYISFCRRFEIETVAMTASMLHGNADVVGNITSGGTESILCAVKVYRDRARHLYPHITQPEMVNVYLMYRLQQSI